MLKTVYGLLIASLLILTTTACTESGASEATTVAAIPAATAVASTADLTTIKTYLLDNTATLHSNTTDLQTAVNTYYQLAQAANFDYAQLWQDKPAEVTAALLAAKQAWLAASPRYEQIEGIVAGVPSLAQYDVILDAGAAGDDPDAAPFDLVLPDGRSLHHPGNLFGILEATLWGTRPDFTSGLSADLDGNGRTDFGEVLPEANILQGSAQAMSDYVSQLQTASQAWEATETDAFTALVVMIPTMNEYFESWKNSRFVAGNTSTQTDFVVISRLADIQDILSSLQVIHKGLSPLIVTVDPAQDAQIQAGLANLRTFVADIYAQEQSGKQFSAEEADLLGSEAQNRAVSLAGQVSQVAAQLNIHIQE